ncbi:MAG TPA: GNAT family N-acetyltransferase [Caulobacteraceae bacterium]
MQAHPNYRPMTPPDGAAILRLHRRAILLDAVRAYSPVMARSWADGMNADYHGRASQAGALIEVAELHGAVVGFCDTLGDEIRGLFVDPGFSRRGVARGLVERAFKRMKGAGLDQVRVIAALSGVGFYEAIGFRPVRGVRHMTRGGLAMPVLEMAKELGAMPPLSASSLSMLVPA